MSNMDTSIHHVTRVNVQYVASNRNYGIVHVFCADGQEFEYTLHADEGQSIQVTFGDPND